MPISHWMFGPPDLARLAAKRDVNALIKALAYRKDAAVRASAAMELVKLGWRPAADENGERYWIAKRSWDKCVEIGAAAIGLLVAVLRDRHDPDCGHAAETLGRIDDSRAAHALITAAKDPDVHIQSMAARALCQARSVQTVEPLLAALQDPNTVVRRAASQALGNLGDPTAQSQVFGNSRGECERGLIPMSSHGRTPIACGDDVTDSAAAMGKLEPTRLRVGHLSIDAPAPTADVCSASRYRQGLEGEFR